MKGHCSASSTVSIEESRKDGTRKQKEFEYIKHEVETRQLTRMERYYHEIDLC